MSFPETLGCHVLMAGALAVLAFVAERLWPRQAPMLHGLWLLVLARLLVPPMFGVPLLEAEPQATVAAVTAEVPLPAEAGVLPAVSWPANPSVALLQCPPEEVADEAAALVPLPLGIAETGAPAAPPTFTLWPWLLALQGLGTLTFLGLGLTRALRFHRGLRQAAAVPDDLQSRVATLARRIGLRRAPRAVFVAADLPPLIWAFFGRARLVLPRDLFQAFTEKEQDGVLLHELAHLKRGDHRWRHFELLALAIWWWLPLSWWASRRLRAAEEASCDAFVARIDPKGRKAYARALVRTLSHLASRRAPVPTPAVGLGAVQDLKRRVSMVLDSVPVAAPRPWVRRSLAAAGALLLVFGPARAEVQEPPAARALDVPGSVVVRPVAPLAEAWPTDTRPIVYGNYKVQPGDSLRMVAQRVYGRADEDTIELLKRANPNVNWARLEVGRLIVVAEAQAKDGAPVDGELSFPTAGEWRVLTAPQDEGTLNRKVKVRLEGSAQSVLEVICQIAGMDLKFTDDQVRARVAASYVTIKQADLTVMQALNKIAPTIDAAWMADCETVYFSTKRAAVPAAKPQMHVYEVRDLTRATGTKALVERITTDLSQQGHEVQVKVLSDEHLIIVGSKEAQQRVEDTLTRLRQAQARPSTVEDYTQPRDPNLPMEVNGEWVLIGGLTDIQKQLKALADRQEALRRELERLERFEQETLKGQSLEDAANPPASGATPGRIRFMEYEQAEVAPGDAGGSRIRFMDYEQAERAPGDARGSQDGRYRLRNPRPDAGGAADQPGPSGPSRTGRRTGTAPARPNGARALPRPSTPRDPRLLPDRAPEPRSAPGPAAPAGAPAAELPAGPAAPASRYLRPGGRADAAPQAHGMSEAPATGSGQGGGTGSPFDRLAAGVGQAGPAAPANPLASLRRHQGSGGGVSLPAGAIGIGSGAGGGSGTPFDRLRGNAGGAAGPAAPNPFDRLHGNSGGAAGPAAPNPFDRLRGNPGAGVGTPAPERPAGAEAPAPGASTKTGTVPAPVVPIGGFDGC